jgi:hypothetical protein
MHAAPATTSAATPNDGHIVDRPALGALMRHLGLSLLMANVVPGLLFYLCMRAGNVWMALVAALVWCYGAMAWRARTKQPASGLLLVTALGLTAKTAFAFASHNTFVYFAQPALNNLIMALVLMLSLLTARPIVARLAHDFYPLSEDVARRPTVQRLFWRLSILWSLICLIKAALTIWLLESMPLETFVAVKGILTLVVVGIGAALTVAAAVRVAGREGLLHA